MNLISENIGALITGKFARIPAVITAGAGNDGVEVNGPALDLLALTKKYHSCKVMIVWEAAIGASESLSIAANIQTSSVSNFGSDTADLSPAFPSAIVQAGGGGGTFQGVTEFSVPLVGAKQYIRLQLTADLSRANTDTVAIAAVFVMGGADQNPVP
jgi:hypothetical protein